MKKKSPEIFKRADSVIGSVFPSSSEQSFKISARDIGLDNLFYLHALSELGVLVTIAGYKKADLISLNDRLDKSINKYQLQRFVSYVLNHKHFAPRNYSVRIKISNVKTDLTEDPGEQIKAYNLVVLYSGGIDSTAGLLYGLDKNKAILPVFINFGQFNNVSELRHAELITKRLNLNLETISFNIRKYIEEGWRDWSYIIPGRNFLLVTLSASYMLYSPKKVGTIYLCATKEEMKHSRNTDKSRYFLKMISKLLSKQFRKEIIVTTPFSAVDKTLLLSYWRKKWISKYKISPLETTTCYYSDGCGACGACLKRTINLIAAGFEKDTKIKKNPLLNMNLIKSMIIQPITDHRLDRERMLDFYIVLEKLYPQIPAELQDIYKKLSSRTKKAVERRQQAIANVIIY